LPKYLKAASEDPLFARIVMGIWGLPFMAIFFYGVLHFDEICPDWLIVFPVAMGAFGAFLFYTAILSDDEAVEKRTDFVGEGGELIGAILVIAVVILAIPIWELMKLLRSDR
jgi:putative effector of murein hydrolase